MSLMRGAYLWLMAARAPPPQSLAMVAMGALSIQTLADTGTFSVAKVCLESRWPRPAKASGGKTIDKSR